ncbi:MAG: hypothetical protein J3K34DRAFT_290564 [Monoraphidium minutum]|nr:MAG: hypothetical protein J3K34DRAFT_290564 [Monoraphidium minutum]
MPTRLHMPNTGQPWRACARWLACMRRGRLRVCMCLPASQACAGGKQPRAPLSSSCALYVPRGPAAVAPAVPPLAGAAGGSASGMGPEPGTGCRLPGQPSHAPRRLDLSELAPPPILSSGTPPWPQPLSRCVLGSPRAGGHGRAEALLRPAAYSILCALAVGGAAWHPAAFQGNPKLNMPAPEHAMRHGCMRCPPHCPAISSTHEHTTRTALVMNPDAA